MILLESWSIHLPMLSLPILCISQLPFSFLFTKAETLCYYYYYWRWVCNYIVSVDNKRKIWKYILPCVCVFLPLIQTNIIWRWEDGTGCVCMCVRKREKWGINYLANTARYRPNIVCYDWRYIVPCARQISMRMDDWTVLIWKMINKQNSDTIKKFKTNIIGLDWFGYNWIALSLLWCRRRCCCFFSASVWFLTL